MSEFLRVIKPHLEAHGIEDAQELAIRMRGLGSDVHVEQVERWLSDELQPFTYDELEILRYVLGLGDAEHAELHRAARRDARARREGWQEYTRRFDELVERFEQGND